jgi:hypothetical protein
MANKVLHHVGEHQIPWSECFCPTHSAQVASGINRAIRDFADNLPIGGFLGSTQTELPRLDLFIGQRPNGEQGVFLRIPASDDTLMLGDRVVFRHRVNRRSKPDGAEPMKQTNMAQIREDQGQNGNAWLTAFPPVDDVFSLIVPDLSNSVYQWVKVYDLPDWKQLLTAPMSLPHGEPTSMLMGHYFWRGCRQAAKPLAENSYADNHPGWHTVTTLLDAVILRNGQIIAQAPAVLLNAMAWKDSTNKAIAGARVGIRGVGRQ